MAAATYRIKYSQSNLLNIAVQLYEAAGAACTRQTAPLPPSLQKHKKQRCQANQRVLCGCGICTTKHSADPTIIGSSVIIAIARHNTLAKLGVASMLPRSYRYHTSCTVSLRRVCATTAHDDLLDETSPSSRTRQTDKDGDILGDPSLSRKAGAFGGELLGCQHGLRYRESIIFLARFVH